MINPLRSSHVELRQPRGRRHSNDQLASGQPPGRASGAAAQDHTLVLGPSETL